MCCQVFSDRDWENLYLILRPRIATWVCTSGLPLWSKQRNEIIEDIVQDALFKTYAYMLRAARGEARIIESLERISTVTAYHCYVDLFRRDRRLQPFPPELDEPGGVPVSSFAIDPAEIALDNVYDELLFIQIARWIADLPNKQRTALLMDLADRMYLDPFELTPLQKALISEGIDMHDYQHPLPEDKPARARHAAHLSLAYKRLKLLAYMYRYALVA